MGHFSGYPLTRWKGKRLMILEEDFSYTDDDGKIWLAPSNTELKTELNGATIPRTLWSLIGSPYVGLYRRASVVHDFFVGEGNNPDVSFLDRRKADKMFFEACKTDGCSWRFAAILYLGVSVGSWASKFSFMNNIDYEDDTLSVEEEKYIVNKFFSLRDKADLIINDNENFEDLERLVDTEINRD
ncbi:MULTISPECIES: DUF1353 domain-containing protein [Flammeovirga]|uniref:DUF1353 domain-containing protein n=1 Tax=Flammeovirga agarivorans TaxID=2726742 RepID=A0A7X8XW19_9BACT|nr:MULTISPECIES: DUF1353 domain-containing protein [Flammeovirga]NLR91655.1 DUF1353 domain-containing protein [Flammeovirga agarivorans]